MADQARTTVSGRSLLAYSMAKLIPGLVTFASVPLWVARFGAAEYGQFAFVWAVSVITGALVVGWIRQSVLRGTGDSTWSIKAISLPIHLALSLLSALPITAIALTSISGHHGVFSFAVSSTAFGAISSVYSIAQAHVQRAGRSGLYAWADTLRTVIALAVSFAPEIVVGHGSVAIMNSGSVGYVVATAVLYRCSAPSAYEMRNWLRSGSELRQMWSFGWPMSLWLGVTGALTYMDRIFVRVMLSPTEAGQYAAIADLVGRGVPMVTFPLTMAIHPAAMELWNRGRIKEAMRTVRRGMTIMLTCVGILTVLTWALAPTVLRLVLPSIPPDRATITLLVVGAAAWQVALLVHKPFEFMGRTRSLLVFALMATVATALVDWTTVPAIGGTGAALGLVVGASLYCILTAVGYVIWVQSDIDAQLRRNHRSHARSSLRSGRHRQVTLYPRPGNTETLSSQANSEPVATDLYVSTTEQTRAR